MTDDRKNIEVFDQDALQRGGYLYTTKKQLSCRLATQRSTDAILAAVRLRYRAVIDIGCGDGFYSIRWWDEGHPKSLVGIDPAAAAIAVADRNKGDRPIQFQIGDAHDLAFADDSFDLALVQSILHHDDDPRNVIEEALRVAPMIVIHEPNGNNPGLKIIEKLSSYHRAHNEKSYTSRQLQRWIEECGGTITYQKFAGFVPMFSPEWLARLMKIAEPWVESMPIIRQIGCAVTVIVAARKAKINKAGLAGSPK